MLLLACSESMYPEQCGLSSWAEATLESDARISGGSSEEVLVRAKPYAHGQDPRRDMFPECKERPSALGRPPPSFVKLTPALSSLGKGGLLTLRPVL